MKNFLALLVVSLFLGNAIAEDGHHQHHSKDKASEEKRHSVKSLSLNNGKKWEVDQTMKENMNAIHSELKKTNELITSKKIAQADYTKLSNLISDSAQKIASNCKMDEKADQTFHVVLGDLLAASDDLKDSKKAIHATEKLAHAFKVYTEYFNHSFSN